MNSGEDFALKLIAEAQEWLARQPRRISPVRTAHRFFSQRLAFVERKAFALSAATRVSLYVDPGLEAVPRLSNGNSHAFSMAVDQLFLKLIHSEPLLVPPFLDEYDRMCNEGEISIAYGGQGNSLVEELLTPAMNIIRAVLSGEGLSVALPDEDGCVGEHLVSDSADQICCFANDMFDPGKFPDSDEGGIPPWVAQSIELNAQWYTLELLSQAPMDPQDAISKTAHYSRKCRDQNRRLTAQAFPRYRDKLLSSWKNA